MALSIRRASFALSTAAAGNTQDVTISGFGTPKAAIFILSGATANDTPAAGAKMSFGFTNGTSEAVMGTASADNAATMDTGRAQRDDCVLFVTSAAASTLSGRFSFNSWITDGVRLDIDTASEASYLCEVILIGGTSVTNTGVLGNPNLGTGTSPITFTPGFEASFVLAVTTGNDDMFPSVRTNGLLSIGCAVNDGADSNASCMFGTQDNVADADTTAYVSNVYCGGQAFSGTLAWGGTIDNYTSTQFDLTPNSSPAGDGIFFLAVQLDTGYLAELFDVSIPTSGNYSESSLGVSPDHVLMSFALAGTRNTLDTTGSGMLSVVSIDDVGAGSTSYCDEDAVADSNANSVSADSFKIYDQDGSTTLAAASGYSLDSNGLSLTLTTNPASALLGWGLAVGSEAASGLTVTSTTDTLVITENAGIVVLPLIVSGTADTLTITENQGTVATALLVSNTVDLLTITENQATLDFTLTVSTTVDSLILTENQSTVSTALLITNTVESLTLTENQATLDFTLTVTGSSDSLVLTENNASIQVGGAITTSTDSLLLVENAATLDFSLTVTGSTDSLTLTENQSIVSFNVTITSSTDSLSLTENNATVDTQLTVSNTLDTLVIAANDATVTTSAAITTGTVALVITENQGTIDTQLTVVSTTEELTIASNDAEIFTTAGQYILGFSSTITSVPMVYVLARTGDNMYVFRHVEDGGTEEIINTGIVASGTDTLLIDVTTDNPKLYIDGALVATSSLSMASTSVSYHGAGALIQSSVTSHMTGRIWNIAYTDPNDGTNSALFPVDEGTGSTLTDSLNGDTATVINFDADMWV